MYIHVYETVHVTGVSVSPSSVSLTTVWQTQQLTATITPANADDQVVSWSSSDTSVATVNSSWLVTCVTPWEATITATTHDGGYTATCGVNDWERHPWANTIWYYTMNNDILNHATTWSTFPNGTLNTAVFSTTRKHGNNSYSLYCDGNTYAYLPTWSLAAFWTSDFTISFWVYSETNSWVHPWIVSCYYSNSDHNYWWRITDRFSDVNDLSFCWKSGSYIDNTSWISIYNDWWHNVVFTRVSWIFCVYLDGNTTPVIVDSTHTTSTIWRNANINFGYNPADNLYSKVYLNDVIFENRWWTAQDVSDYYTLTNI